MTEAPTTMPRPDPSLPPANEAGQPLATFILFAYNQEKYVREAVEGALAQTYAPLEIILSDDCSPDSTFAIMQEMAAAYRGSHMVRAVQTPHNLGLIQHVLLRGREAQGEIVVVAAGDDVSKPGRVAALAKAFTPQIGALYSLFDQIDENGEPKQRHMERPRPKSFEAELAASMCLSGDTSQVRVTQGSTAAYRAELFDVPVNGDRKPYSEEMLLCFYCHLKGLRVELVKESLVDYRQHAEAMAHVTEADLEARARRPEAVVRFGRRAGITMYYDFHEIAFKNDSDGRIDRSAMLSILSREETKYFWLDMPFRRKLAAAIAALIAGDFQLLAWCFARLLGFYGIIKRMRRSK